MSGRTLYDRYAEICLQLSNCEVDTWDSLSDEDQSVWNALAAELAGWR